MASALSSAFQGSTVADENSFKPTRAAPPVPSVAYTNTVPSRAPEQGERPIQQNSSAQHRARQVTPAQTQQTPSQYHTDYEPTYSATSYYQQQQQQYQQQQFQQQQYQQQQFQSRPSTQASFSHPQAPNTRGRLQAENATYSSAKPEYAPQQPPPVPPSSLTNQPQQRKRSGSFSFLRRSSSNQPSNRIPQSQQQAAIPAGIAAQVRNSHSSHQPHPSDGSITSNSTGLLRSRSKDGRSERNMLRKQSKLKQQQAEFERQQRLEAANRQPPRLPQHSPLPGIDTFGGDNGAQHAYADPGAPSTVPGNAANFSRPGGMSSGHHSSSSPAYALQAKDATTNGGDYYEPSGERSASMTNRGRYSYASSTAQAGNVNSPRRVRRRKDPTPFNVLVIGTKNSGKSSFISFLRNSLARRSDRQEPTTTTAAATPDKAATRSTFTSQYLETEIDGERVGVTLWDSAGLEKNIVDLQLREMTAFLEAKFEETFSEEQKVVRSPGFKDTHIHCVFLVLDPIRLDSNVLTASSTGSSAGGLDDDLDLQVLRALWGKTTVIPVISKADTLTINHMNLLKRAVWQSVKTAKLNPLDALELDEDDELEEEDEDEDEENDNEADEEGDEKRKRSGHARQSSLSSTISDEDPYIPMSILSPDPYSMPPYTKYAPKSQSEIGRRYAWGFASPFDPQHCDFIRLRDTVFSEWRGDLRELSRVKWYEQWRTSRLRHAPQAKSRSKVHSSGSQALPVRESTDRQTHRDFSNHAQSVPRGYGAAQSMSGAQPANVGMAVTTDNSRY